MTRPGYVLVTGGAKRLGAAIVRALAVDGWPVLIHYRHSADDAEALMHQIKADGGAAELVQFALDDPADMERRVAALKPFAGAVPWIGLVNNASDFSEDQLATISAASVESAMRTNFVAPMLLARALHATVSGAARGFVINILDQKTQNPNPDFLSYTFSKLALHAATDTLAQAVAPRCRVCAVSPGLLFLSGPQTEENFERVHNRTLLEQGAHAESVAEAVAFLARSDEITGAVINVDGGQRLVGSLRDVLYS